MKKTNKYHLSLRLLETANGEQDPSKSLELDVENHDEIFNIIERIRQKNLFDAEQQSTEFAIGLKLFSEVLIKNRNHELFTELGPAFQLFMKRLKAM
ncbi:protein of unknown function [Cnuella takakiae]|uniref:DUF3861 domain-containing protein n=1 Tax=Cnuella takakiae TaxID=1302690 RepID=A0A1M5A0A0_9BACT|nr:DUF3861 domain-containing protein [Cnuella takakiae]OLY92143.1 hypothetical protein BUE76_09720 [Cnuella takakiae]SHF23688.1 protein of unknown function [Cnuella takakiae]